MAMFKIIYRVELKDKDEEIMWLRSQQVYAATEIYWDWISNKEFIRLGMIVTEDIAMAIRLRHGKLDLQIENQ
jgi:hypothetical protein